MRTFLVIILLAVGCGTPRDEAVDAGQTPPADAEMSLADTGPAVVCPTEGQLFCGEKCIDVTFDLDHCGTCSNSCTRGKMTCMMGECLCLGDLVMCDDECHDTTNNRDYCGSCDVSCTTAEACVDGSCVPIADDPGIYGVLIATNEARAAQQDCGVNGIRPAVGAVVLNEQLTVAAQGHAEDMATNLYFAHESPDGNGPGDRARAAGYEGSAGENIAKGQDSAEAAVAAWVESDGHCKNMMNGGYEELGVGYSRSATSGEIYWVQLFGSP